MADRRKGGKRELSHSKGLINSTFNAEYFQNMNVGQDLSLQQQLFYSKFSKKIFKVKVIIRKFGKNVPLFYYKSCSCPKQNFPKLLTGSFLKCVANDT